MTDGQVWLAQDAYERLREELAELVRRRSQTPVRIGTGTRDSSDQNTDEQVLSERRERENRIRRLQEILLHAVVDRKPPDDGVAEPGMVLTVHYADDPDPETFLLARREEGAYPGLETCSPDSPLGQALSGAREGEERHYRCPDGRSGRVRLIRAVPYGDHPGPA